MQRKVVMPELVYYLDRQLCEDVVDEILGYVVNECVAKMYKEIVEEVEWSKDISFNDLEKNLCTISYKCGSWKEIRRCIKCGAVDIVNIGGNKSWIMFMYGGCDDGEKCGSDILKGSEGTRISATENCLKIRYTDYYDNPANLEFFVVGNGSGIENISRSRDMRGRCENYRRICCGPVSAHGKGL